MLVNIKEHVSNIPTEMQWQWKTKNNFVDRTQKMSQSVFETDSFAMECDLKCLASDGCLSESRSWEKKKKPLCHLALNVNNPLLILCKNEMATFSID